MIQVKVIEDSVSPSGDRLTTMEVEFHRYILAEFNKHRMLSNSASSSRAIPVNRIIRRVVESPAIPVEWGREQRGMQAKELLDEETAAKAEQLWLKARDLMIGIAEQMVELEVHKQIVNRLLEPFSWQAVVVTGTYWQNLFNLRAHPDAQPEFRELAILMQEAYKNSTPKSVGYGYWHLPYVTEDERASYSLEQQRQLSAARCARTSYWNQGKINPDSDLELFFRLVDSDPIHSVPTEMQATPVGPLVTPKGNFKGWRQFRHFIEESRGYESLC